jgi:cysteine desulfurase
MSMIYLDHQATTPVDPAVLAKMAHVGEYHFANPGSTHPAGAEALGQIDTARAALARFLHARTGEVYFTSGATEANNLAIKGIAYGRPGHIVTTAVEHKSVLDTVRYLGTQGHDVTVLPVDHDGRVSPLQVAECLRPDTLLVSVMLANNEVSTIQPIAEIAEVTRAAGVALHCDATQGAGYVDLDVTALGVDLLSLSGHKIYGPKGVGVLYVSGELADRVDLTPLCHGGGQERGLRAGTLNTAGIAGLGVAVTLAAEHRSAEATRLAGLRAVFLDELACLAPFELNSGTGPGFLPHAVSLSLTGVDTQELLPSLADIAISAGSACNATSDKPSHVLTALGLSAARIRSTVRLSVGRFTGLDDVMRAAELLADAAAPLSGGRAAA